MIRRLDHVAIVVKSTDEALQYFSGHLGLPVAATETLEDPHVRLTYLSTGNAFLQLVEPLSPGTGVGEHLSEHGEGIHHVCFGCDDPIADAGGLGVGAVTRGSGRGRVSAFVPGPTAHGVRVECTAFDRVEDVDDSAGALGI